MTVLHQLVNDGSNLTKKYTNNHQVSPQDLEIKSLQLAWRSIWTKNYPYIGICVINNCQVRCHTLIGLQHPLEPLVTLGFLFLYPRSTRDSKNQCEPLFVFKVPRTNYYKYNHLIKSLLSVIYSSASNPLARILDINHLIKINYIFWLRKLRIVLSF